MFCYKCGKKTSGSDNFCQSCGSPIIKKYTGSEESNPLSDSKEEINVSNKKYPYRWFDTKRDNIKNKEELSVEQIRYLQVNSFSIFGPLNVLVRKHWDLLVFLIIISPVSNIINSTMFVFIFVLYMWFGLTHGRRLAWNRNSWNSFEAFKQSEQRWYPWGLLFFVFNILILYLTHLVG